MSNYLLEKLPNDKDIRLVGTRRLDELLQPFETYADDFKIPLTVLSFKNISLVKDAFQAISAGMNFYALKTPISLGEHCQAFGAEKRTAFNGENCIHFQ